MDYIFEWIANISAILTCIGFFLSLYWNRRSNKESRNARLELYNQFAQAIGNIRELEVKKAQIEKERLYREGKILEQIRDMKTNAPDIDPSEKNRILNEYSIQITEKAVAMSDLNRFIAEINFDSVKTLSSLIEKHKKSL